MLLFVLNLFFFSYYNIISINSPQSILILIITMPIPFTLFLQDPGTTLKLFLLHFHYTLTPLHNTTLLPLVWFTLLVSGYPKITFRTAVPISPYLNHALYVFYSSFLTSYLYLHITLFFIFAFNRLLLLFHYSYSISIQS